MAAAAKTKRRKKAPPRVTHSVQHRLSIKANTEGYRGRFDNEHVFNVVRHGDVVDISDGDYCDTVYRFRKADLEKLVELLNKKVKVVTE